MNLKMLVLFSNICFVSSLSIFIDIFKSKSIRNGIILHCQKDYEIVLLERVFFENNINVISFKTFWNSSHIGYFHHAKVGFVVDASCKPQFQIFNNVNRFFGRSYTWIMETSNLDDTKNTLSHYPLEINSDFILISKRNESDIYDLYEVFSKGFYTQGPFVVNYLGYWDVKLRLNQSHRTDLTGVVLKCPIVILDQLVNQTFEHYLTNTKPGSIVDSLHKLKFYTLLKYLQNIYNYSYILQRTNSWGYLYNGTFDGVVGALQKGEADIGGTPVFYRSDRAKVIDYASPTWQSRPCFILRHPKYPGGFYSIYTRPLTSSVWYCILALLFLAGTILCLMLKIKSLKVPGDDEDSSTSVAILFIFSAISQQGTTITRSSLSIKVLIFITFVFTLTLYQYYNATVVSTLLREPPKLIRNLKDLLKSNLKVGVEDVLYNKDFFKRTNDPVAIELYHQKIVTGHQENFYKPEYGMYLVKKGGFAYHVDSVTAYHIMRRTFSEREICDAHEIYLYPPQNMVAVLRKDSPYKELITIGIRKVFESGLMHRLRSVWDESKPPCVHTPDSSIFSVTLREFSMALIMLVFGMVMSVFILFCEILLCRFRQKIIEFRH